MKESLPLALSRIRVFLLCTRCSTHLKNKQKQDPPSKSYWNNHQPGSIPEEMKEMTAVETRLISRIVPFLKIIKYEGKFGQHGFKGQVILFAQDVFEVTEQIPKQLPRQLNETGIIAIAESLEDIYLIREFHIKKNKIDQALHWLIRNNPLYRDVDNITSSQNYDAGVQDIVRLVEEPHFQDVANPAALHHSDWRELNATIKILNADWNQGNDFIFNAQYTGRQ